MTRFDIPWEDNYVGDWVGEPSRLLRIRKIAPRKYLATLTLDGSPVARDWMDNEQAVDMPAEYTFDALDGSDFAVDLWPPGSRISIHLNYEPSFELDMQRRDALTMGLSCDESLIDKMDDYTRAIGGLDYLFRREA